MLKVTAQKTVITSLVFLTMLMFGSIAMAAELVNLNKASAAAMQQNLVGIGPIKAEAIISYRKKNGKYKSIDDLLNVKGIGPALVKKNKRYLSLSKGAVSGDDKAYAASKKQAGKAKSSTSKKKSSTTSKSTKKDSTTAKSTTKKSNTTAKSSSKKSSTTAKTTKKKSTSKSSKKSTKKSACKGKKKTDCTTTKKKKKKTSKPAS